MKPWVRNSLLVLAGAAITLLLQMGLPTLGIVLYGTEFRTAYVNCQLANIHAAALNSLVLDTALDQRLRKTELVDQLSCRDSEILRSRLQQFEVSNADIDLIEKGVVGSIARADLASHFRENARRSALDLKMHEVIDLYGLRPLEIRKYEADPKWKLGQALFFDPVLSGDRDVACATCHLLQYGLSDGLPRSVGANGEGLGADRKLVKGVQVHPRHSLDLWNRDNNAVSAFFWDGHVEVLDSRRRLFRSPLGNALPKGFQNAMAVQAIFPIAIPDEMLGYFGEHSSSTLPAPNANKLNDLVVSPNYRSDVARIQSVHRQLLKRLLSPDSSPEPWQQEYRTMFHDAYPQKRLSEITVVDVGNAIAHFEELAFASAESPWDRFLGGDPNAISEQAISGAILFYGKGRCAACHSGPLFSDFRYHGVGIFSRIYVAGKYVNDLGRGAVTGNPVENYHFRTSPLRNVTKFGPYFHDGSTPELRAAIFRHLEPLAKSGAYNPDGSFAIERDQADSISPILASGIKLTQNEVQSLLAFLEALDAQSRSREQIIPSRVPSGIPISH
jgi:cytochrome c peroxidase